MNELPAAIGLHTCIDVVEAPLHNVHLIHVFTGRPFDTFPTAPFTFWVFGALSLSLRSARMHQVSLAIVSLQEGLQVRRMDGTTTFPPDARRLNVAFRFDDVVFPAPGEYTVGLFIEDNLIAETPLRIHEREH